MLKRVHLLRRLLQAFGPGWLAYRLGYLIRLRIGYLRLRLPVRAWQDLPLGDFLHDRALAEPETYSNYRRTAPPSFFFSPSDRQRFQPHFVNWDSEGLTPVIAAEQVANGELTYFHHTVAQVGMPPDWHANPFTGQKAPADRHWSQISDFDFGDIKVIWDPNRFGFVFPLVRAYWRAGDERYAELFWRTVEDWQRYNPPQQGPNWKCGQEISFRVMAWCFGLYGLLHSQSTTASRVVRLAQMIAVSGQRIEANLGYALSQRNNHGLSEGMGLWTIGALFPELKRAAHWRETGRETLERLGPELIYDDGSFVQHSVNYQRLMLHDYVWSLRLGDLHNSPFGAKLRSLVGRAANWLYQIQDETSGRVPCYGANDGALILPLNNCDYRDFRPVVQAAQYLHTRTRSYGSGPWDEDLLWLFGPDALEAPRAALQRRDLQAKAGGYYTLRTSTGFAFTRCTSFRHRPSQADMLHVDLWWQGQNIALDAGTYSYNERDPWNSPLAQTMYHNTVTVDGLDQMERVGKFLWLPWLRGQAEHSLSSVEGQPLYWAGTHDGYQRLEQPVSHRRGIVRLGDDCWLIVDLLNSSGEHHYRLHWLLADLPYEWNEDTGHLTLETPVGAYHVQMGTLSGKGQHSLVRADQTSPRGWRAPYYYHREPALSAELVAQAKATLLWTLFGPEPYALLGDEHTLQVTAQDWQANLHWHRDVETPLITSIEITDSNENRLVAA